MHAAAQHIERAFDDDEVLAVHAVDRGHQLAVGVEGQLRKAREFVGSALLSPCRFCARRRDDCGFGGVTQHAVSPSGVTSTEPSQQREAVRSSVQAAASSLPVMSTADAEAPSVQTCVSVMRFWVRVPVLSEQMTEALPRVSTAGRRRIMALRLTMRCTPRESTMVTMAGRPSGMAETAK